MSTIDDTNKEAVDPGKEKLRVDENAAQSNEAATQQNDNPFKLGTDDEIEASRQGLKRAMSPLESRTANPGSDEQEPGAPSKPSGNQQENEKSDDDFIDITNDAGEIE